MPRQSLDDSLAASLGLDLHAPGDVRLRIGPEQLNGVGKMFGPVGFALVDYAMTGAAAEAVEEHLRVVTINVAINFVASAEAGEIRCLARVERRTRSIVALTAEVRDSDQRQLITALGSFAIIDPR